MLIDTHTHVSGESYKDDREAVLARAKEAGVGALIAIGSGYGVARNLEAVEFALSHDDVYATVGVHPHEASEVTASSVWDDLRKVMDRGGEKVVAVGEIGLDYHYNNSPQEKQREVFAQSLQVARERKLPVSIHNRESTKDLYDILVSEKASDFGGVIHCFTESYDWGKKFLDLGFKLSISGVVTFKKALELQDAVRRLPLEGLVVETDCPFLSPIPHRGKRNEPAFVKHVAEGIAKLKAPLTYVDVERITTGNAVDVFGLEKYREELERPRIAYTIRNSLYLNITNRCSNPCTFCPKFDDWKVKGYYLRLRKEPSFEEIVREIGDPSKYDEVVFVGFGEPTIALDMLKRVSKWSKEHGAKSIRVDTDGLGNLYHERNIVPELAEAGVDAVNVSLNGPDAETYNRVTRTPYKENGYEGVKEFIRECKKRIRWTQASVVTAPGVDVEASRRVAEEELGVQFRARDYQQGVG
ncbi:MAG: YchF/TatD family DNA exonuclease [Bdellovibrionota bacterium]